MKIQHGRGLERNGAKVSKGGFVEKVALEPRLEFRKQKEGRKEGNTPSGWGPYPGAGGAAWTRGTQPPKGLCCTEEVVDVPDLS